MRRIFIITSFILLFFFAEFFIFNYMATWLMPNLLLLLIIYFNLTLGIRYGLFVAVTSGMIKDCFHTGYFGVNIFSFIVCAYMTTLLGKYIYHAGSTTSRLLLVFILCLINGFVHYFLYMIFGLFYPLDVLRYVLFPEIAVTLIISSFIFHTLKQCASKLSV